jgi:hypothetical protein
MIQEELLRFVLLATDVSSAKIGRLSGEARKFPESIGGPAGAAAGFFQAILIESFFVLYT